MDTTTIGILAGMMTAMTTAMLTVTVYLDRAARNDMAAGFAALSQRFDRFEVQVHKRFDQVDKQFEQIDRRFDRIDRWFDRIDRRFEQMEKRLDASRW